MAKQARQKTDVFQFVDMKGDDECWPWKSTLNKSDNRPYFSYGKTKRLAYAVTLELFSGEEANGRYVLHQCDNKVCCNPHHLKWGTHQENMDEMKDRERHGLPKIVVRAMFKLKQQGKSYTEIGELYGVDRTAVSKAIHRYQQECEEELNNR